MAQNMRLRERDSELFMLVNTLKTQGMVYQKTKPRLYSALIERRSDIDPELSADDCYMCVVPEKGLIALSFYQDDEDYKNGLRKKFSVNEMKLYAALLALYTEKYIAEGDFVTADVSDIIGMWEKLGFSTKSASASRSLLDPLLKEMKRYGIISASGVEQYII